MNENTPVKPKQLTPWQINWKTEYACAPSYYIIKVNDGADIQCDDCKGMYDQMETNMYQTFTPNGAFPQTICQYCLDEDWLKNAKNMGVKT